MPSIQIPQKNIRRWTGPYPGNYYGDLWKTFNVDLDKEPGKISLSPRLKRIFDTGDTTDTGSLPFDVITGFLYSDADCIGRWWGVSQVGGRVFRSGANLSPADSDWTADTYANTPTQAYDFAIFGNDSRQDSGRNQLLVTNGSNISVLNDTGGNTWNNSYWQTTLNQPAIPLGAIEYFPLVKKILVASANLLHTIQRTSDSANETASYARLVLPAEYSITRIFTTPQRAWLIAKHNFGGIGAIVEWDGFSQSYNQIHQAFSTYPLSGVNYNGVPIVINDKGVVLEHNGSTFVPMRRNGQDVSLGLNNTPLSLGANGIAPRGMAVTESGLILINAGGPTTVPLGHERMSAGIWCLNPITGQLYSKYTPGKWGEVALGDTSIDFGAQIINRPGAIATVNASVSSQDFIASGIYEKDNSSVFRAIFAPQVNTDIVATQGYFITQYYPSDNIKDAWDSLWLRFKQFSTAANRIVVKARGVKPLVTANKLTPLQKVITWTSTTTFTVTLAGGDDSLAVGDEVEVLSGANAGVLAHITTISGAHAALQTITIDETVVSATTTGTARFERWKKVGVISSTTKYEDNVNIGINSSFIQLKVQMRGPASEMAISDLILNSRENIINQK